jgi:hypothetical protein
MNDEGFWIAMHGRALVERGRWVVGLAVGLLGLFVELTDPLGDEDA